ncbi:MAG: hypothetical protein J6S67_23845 [Methanobrevibacter sp.]|nr:hypothetical protein [Methanobrevibacter sp.]
MAKVVGLVGSASGKIGNIVYAVTNGIQVARVYQPDVSNPKSGLQTMQRAKGNLAGRISSFTPRTAIMGLGVNNRARRGAFLRNILKKATIIETNRTYNAKIANEDMLFSVGSVLLSVENPVFASVAGSLGITLTGKSSTLVSSEDYAALQTRIVTMVYDGITNDLVEIVTKIANKPAQGTTASTNLSISYDRAFSAVSYLIPMSTEDGSAVSISTDVATKDDDYIAAALSVNGNAIVFKYGKSSLAGTTTYTPPAKKSKKEE